MLPTLLRCFLARGKLGNAVQIRSGPATVKPACWAKPGRSLGMIYSAWDRSILHNSARYVVFFCFFAEKGYFYVWR